jgi:hypothetical protein
VKFGLTKPQCRILLECLFSQGKIYNSPVYADIKVGVARVTSAQFRSLEKLEVLGLVEWKYAKIYSTRNLFDVALTPHGYHKAIRIVLEMPVPKSLFGTMRGKLGRLK